MNLHWTPSSRIELRAVFEICIIVFHTCFKLLICIFFILTDVTFHIGLIDILIIKIYKRVVYFI